MARLLTEWHQAKCLKEHLSGEQIDFIITNNQHYAWPVFHGENLREPPQLGQIKTTWLSRVTWRM